MAFLDESGVSRLVSLIQEKIIGCQPKLISGENIRTINGSTILGSGDIAISVPSTAFSLVGTQTGTSKIAITPGASEIYVEVYTGNHSAMYSGIFLTDSMTTGVFNLGGYYMSATDYGLCNVNITKSSRTGQLEVAIRNHIYGGTNYTSSATIRVFYR